MIHLVFLILMSFTILAAPKEIEVWFISHAKKAQLEKLIQKSPFVFSKLTAELECQEMGDYCFDPQFGLYKKDDLSADVDQKSLLLDTPVIPTSKSIERDLIDCDPKNHFDVFCGKAKPEAKSQSKLDVWVDTSSSMKEFDYMEKDGSCHRKSLVKTLDDVCGFNQKVNVMMFDTSIKQAGSIDQVCNNQGLNDYKRLMDWIERSEARKLVVITDIYEFHKEFSDFIESKNGKLRGDKDPLTAKQMSELADQLAKSCK